MSGTVISVQNLGKRYLIADGSRVRYKTVRESLTGALSKVLRSGGKSSAREFWALRGVSFEIKQSEVVGVIGRNGAGKSTLLKLLSRITDPSEGRARIRGRVGSLLEVGTGFHPELTGRENIFLSGAILGMKRAEILQSFDEIVAFSEVEKFLDTPLKRYSSGMYLRLAFAVAAHFQPDILFIDEVLAVGDAAFQKKCVGKVAEVSKHGRTVIFVSHNMGIISSLCSRAIMLSGGRVAADGPARDVVHQALCEQKQGNLDEDVVRNRVPGYGEHVRLTKARMRNPAGTTVLFQEPLLYDLQITADRPFRELRLGGTIVNGVGLPVASYFTADTFDIEAGETIDVQLEIDNFNLAPDYYSLGFAIGTGGRSENWNNLDIVGGMAFDVAMTGQGELHLASWQPHILGNVLIPKTTLRAVVESSARSMS
jgi:lipopolysaccharide transport system ATP-binding protein